MNCIQPERAGGGDVEVAAVVGLDLVDRREDLPAHAVLDAGGLVDREQERRDAELVDEEVRHADRGGAGRRQRVGRVVERRRAAGCAAGLRSLAGLLAGGALELADELLGVDVAGAEGLVALALTCARGTVRASSRPGSGWARRASRCRPAWASSVGVGVPGAAGTVGTGGACVGSGVGVAIGPLSMTSLIVPVMPGICDLADRSAGRHVDGGLDALARDQDDGDGVQLGAGRDRGNAKAGRGGDQRDDALPSFHS